VDAGTVKNIGFSTDSYRYSTLALGPPYTLKFSVHNINYNFNVLNTNLSIGYGFYGRLDEEEVEKLKSNQIYIKIDIPFETAISYIPSSSFEPYFGLHRVKFDSDFSNYSLIFEGGIKVTF